MEQLEEMCVDVNLDEGLATEILVRLPARSVLRYRAICKDWLRITACQSFLRAHARRRPLEVLFYTRRTVVQQQELDGAAGPRWPGRRWDAARQRWRFPRSPMIQEVEDRFFAISKDHRSNDSGYVELDALSITAHRPASGQRLARYPSNCVLLASLDGLLLLRSSKSVFHCQHLVCNPLTRQWSDLPPLIRDAGVNAQQRESGFYFHEPSGEYRLLCHVTFYQPRPESWGYYVFSAGADKPRRLNTEATPMWNTVVTTLRSHPSLMKPAFYDNLMAPAVLHGHLHWMQHIEAGFTGQIVAFDTVTEMFRRMAPPPMTHNDPEHSHLLVADGSLMASELGQLFVDLWVLQGYDGGAASGRWERHVRVEVPCHTDNRLLIATGGDGGDVILGTPGGVVVYNVRSGTVRQVMDIDASRSDTVVSPSRVVFRESIVRHRFFEARPHPGLRYFSFCS